MIVLVISLYVIRLNLVLDYFDNFLDVILEVLQEVVSILNHILL
jgi:hypothetical protein